MSGEERTEHPQNPEREKRVKHPQSPEREERAEHPQNPNGAEDGLGRENAAAMEKKKECDAPRIRFLKGEECLEAQSLWREVFDEDTERFTDYYFSYKASKNSGFVLEGEDGIRAMLYLTPERVMAGKDQVDSSYIVGVATKEQYRHRGYMASLLREAFGMLYGQRQPFVFLMPASPDIYTPFAFTYIYEKPVWNAASLKKERMVKLEERDAERMAAFARDFLKREKTVYICRDRAYYILQLLELEAQEGCILGYEEPENSKKLKGLCMYTCEGGSPELLEVLADAETESEFVERRAKKEPVIMARIIHLESMLSLMRAKEPLSFVLGVKDLQIGENNGRFRCRAERGKIRAERCSPETLPDTVVSVEELTAVLFGYRRTEDPFLAKLIPLSPVWINEIV